MRRCDVLHTQYLRACNFKRDRSDLSRYCNSCSSTKLMLNGNTAEDVDLTFASAEPH